MIRNQCHWRGHEVEWDLSGVLSELLLPECLSTNSNNFNHPSLGTWREGSEKGASIAAAENCPPARRSASRRNDGPLPVRHCTGCGSVTCGLRSLPHLTRQTQTFEVARPA